MDVQQRIRNTVIAMDSYFKDKTAMGVLWLFIPSADGIRYTIRHKGADCSSTSQTSVNSPARMSRFWTAHAGTLVELLMPELRTIARENHTWIRVEPYVPIEYTNSLPIRPPVHGSSSKFWRLEVDEEQEARGIWKFKPEIPIQSDTLLYLKFIVCWSLDREVPGVWVEQ